MQNFPDKVTYRRFCSFCPEIPNDASGEVFMNGVDLPICESCLKDLTGAGG